MRGRAGFTLIELMVAVVITATVALLGYAAASAAFDTRDRQRQHRDGVEARAALRALLLDALRHPAEGGGAAMNDTLFAIDGGVDAAGLPTDAVHFLSRGIGTPRGASGGWSVSLLPGPQGVRLLATPSDRRAAALDALLPGVSGVQAYVLDRTADPAWSDRWEVAGRVPAAVALAFYGPDGAPTGPPLVVHSGLEEVR